MSAIEISDAALNAARDASAAPLSWGNGRGAIDAALEAAAPLIVATQKAAELRGLARDLRDVAAMVLAEGMAGDDYVAGVIGGYEAAATVLDVRADQLDGSAA